MTVTFTSEVDGAPKESTRILAVDTEASAPGGEGADASSATVWRLAEVRGNDPGTHLCDHSV